MLQNIHLTLQDLFRCSYTHINSHMDWWTFSHLRLRKKTNQIQCHSPISLLHTCNLATSFIPCFLYLAFSSNYVDVLFFPFFPTSTSCITTSFLPFPIYSYDHVSGKACYTSNSDKYWALLREEAIILSLKTLQTTMQNKETSANSKLLPEWVRGSYLLSHLQAILKLDFFFASRLFFFIPHRDRFPRLGGIRRNWFLSAQIQNSVQRLCFEKLVLFTLLTWAGRANAQEKIKIF